MDLSVVQVDWVAKARALVVVPKVVPKADNPVHKVVAWAEGKEWKVVIRAVAEALALGTPAVAAAIVVLHAVRVECKVLNTL